MPPTDFILELMKCVLNNNVFLFQDKIFKQWKGICGGASFDPKYAWNKQVVSFTTLKGILSLKKIKFFFSTPSNKFSRHNIVVTWWVL